MKSLFDSVTKLEGAMTFHRDRHSVLAGNLANLDTPGYQPLDLERTSEAQGPAGAMTRTDPKHLQAVSADGTSTLAFADPSAAGADGNAVNLEREMAKVAANRVRYATSSELVSRRLALLRYAATDGS
jgi:flagellar basal-body rod protein FlgB